MNRDQALAVLREHADEIRAQGVVRLALFGSVARGEARPDSDIDILVDYDEGRRLSLTDVSGLQAYLADLLGCDVEVADRRHLKPFVKDNILAEAIEVFPRFDHRMALPEGAPPLRRSPRQPLQDMLDALSAIEYHVAGSTFERFQQDHLLRAAVEHEIATAAEASRRLPADLTARHPKVHWDELRATGDALRRDYHEDHTEAVWALVTRHLVLLKRTVKEMIEKVEEYRILTASFSEFEIPFLESDIEWSEGPDFYLDQTGRRIAIELVSYNQGTIRSGGNRRRQVEGEWHTFRDQARSAVRNHVDIREIDVFLHFSYEERSHEIRLLPRRKWNELIEELCRFIAEKKPELGDHRGSYWPDQSRFPLMARYLSAVDLTNFANRQIGEYADWRWNGDAGYIGLTERDLAQAIRAKSTARCGHEKWLIIHGGVTIGSMLPPIDTSGVLTAMQNVESELRAGDFDRVLFWSAYRPCRNYYWTPTDGWREHVRQRSDRSGSP